MPALQFVADLLRRLPRPVRQGIYTVWTLLGAVLAAWQQFSWPDLGSVSSTEALEVYVFLSPVLGTLAAVNTTKPRESEMVDFPEDVDDLPSFEAVGDPDEVFV
jgi:hypothetical protein